jgi:hypothetical protein
MDHNLVAVEKAALVILGSNSHCCYYDTAVVHYGVGADRTSLGGSHLAGLAAPAVVAIAEAEELWVRAARAGAAGGVEAHLDTGARCSSRYYFYTVAVRRSCYGGYGDYGDHHFENLDILLRRAILFDNEPSMNDQYFF